MACSLVNGRVVCQGTEILLNLADSCRFFCYFIVEMHFVNIKADEVEFRYDHGEVCMGEYGTP